VLRSRNEGKSSMARCRDGDGSKWRHGALYRPVQGAVPLLTVKGSTHSHFAKRRQKEGPEGSLFVVQPECRAESLRSVNCKEAVVGLVDVCGAEPIGALCLGVPIADPQVSIVRGGSHVISEQRLEERPVGFSFRIGVA
jgi:hypothetical protein